MRSKRIFRLGGVALAGLGLVWACGFDNTLREYLSARFWLPFAKRSWSFAKPHIRRRSAAYAGMTAAAGDKPLDKLRAAYQQIAQVETEAINEGPLRQALAAAKGNRSLTAREREEVNLIDAKIDMRAGTPDAPERLESAKKKLEAFLRTARTPEFLSEARGWLARVHYLLGDQAAAGKIYLDELNRNGSNLTQESLLNSLQMVYGYDGGPQLLAHLDEYFDTPEHAAFAITLATNPHWYRDAWTPEPPDRAGQAYAGIRGLLEKHAELLQSNTGANALALLTMRTALRMGDLPEARKISETVSADAAVRSEPDFQWMSASGYFLSREYAAAEVPLLALFRSARSSNDQKAAAAYGLCGVYQKTGNVMEQLRFALWLHTAVRKNEMYLNSPGDITDYTVYWNSSGWDLGWLLEAEASLKTLQAFVEQNPGVDDLRVVQYALAVRLTREERYDEAAELYDSIHAIVRGPRTHRLAALYRETKRDDLSDAQRLEARYRMAEFLSANPVRIYFNDNLWHGYQSYAFQGDTDSRLTRAEREAQMQRERKLKDDQEELWRAYLMLRDVTRDAGKTDLGHRAAALAVSCLRQISSRFGREEDIRRGDVELSAWLRR